MAEILPPFVQHTISTSAYIMDVRSSANFDRNNSTKKKNALAKYSSSDALLRKTPTENDDREDHEVREERLESEVHDDGFFVTKDTENSLGVTSAEPCGDDEEECLTRRLECITLNSHKLTSSNKDDDDSGDADNLHRSDDGEQKDSSRPTQNTEAGPLNDRGPMNGRPTNNGHCGSHVGVAAGEFYGSGCNTHFKYFKPSPSSHQPEYIAPLLQWNYEEPSNHLPSQLSTYMDNGYHSIEPSRCGGFLQIPMHPMNILPSINVLPPATVARVSTGNQMSFASQVDPRYPSHINGSHVYIGSKSTQGYPGQRLLSPVSFGQVSEFQVCGFSASSDLDLASEYVTEQQQLEDHSKQMNGVPALNPCHVIPDSTALVVPYTGGSDIADLYDGTVEPNYPGVYNGDSENNPLYDHRFSPCSPRVFQIPSSANDQICSLDFEAPGSIYPDSSYGAPCIIGLETGPQPTGASAPGIFPHQTGTISGTISQAGIVSLNVEDFDRQQTGGLLRSASSVDGWSNNDLQCNSLSPVGSVMSEHSGRNVRHGSETGFERDSEKSRSFEPNSVSSSECETLFVSPMSTAETESSGDESFEERQSKMTEAETKAESYGEEKLISQDSNGDTPLHLAMIDDDWYLAKSILSRLSSLNLIPQVINTPNKLQQTPLCLAVICNKSGIVEMLVENGSDVNVHMKTWHDKLGPKFCQPLHLAASRGQLWKKTLRRLMRAESMDMDAFNSDGKSAMHCAIESHGKRYNDEVLDCKEILRLLAERGANLNQPDCGHEKTPLHYAIERRDVGLVSRLLCLASSVASHREPNSISQMLEAKTGNGNTALHLAASVEMNTQEHKKMIQQLMCKGADPSLKNSDGFLPRELTKNREIVELLKGRTTTGRSHYSDKKRIA